MWVGGWVGVGGDGGGHFVKGGRVIGNCSSAL